MATWSDGTSVNRTAAELEGLTPDGFQASDIDADILAWDDPMGIGFAAPMFPWAASNQAGFTANRAGFARAVSGGLVNFIHYHVFTQSGNIDFAIYENTGVGSAARPGTRLWSSGSFACPAAGARSVAVSPGILVKARRHWFGFAADNTTVSMYQITTPQQFVTALEGWGAAGDSKFPLPNPAGSVSNGYFRFPLIRGGRT